MGKYGDTAIMATKMFLEGRAASPIQAWDSAVRKIFPNRKSSQEKGCPRAAFLGLCENGEINNIPEGSYCQSILNKKYAVDAVRLLRKNHVCSKNENSLWNAVAGRDKKSNHQIDIVLSLWNTGLIKK
jgi:hypothetical protein